MSQISQEQAQALLEAGHIGQNTYDQILASNGAGANELSDKEIDAQEAQKKLDQNYGLTPSQAISAQIPPIGNVQPNTYGATPEQVEALKNRTAQELVSGSMGSANLPLPIAIGAIRKTPTGKLLGTVSKEALNAGQEEVEHSLASQALEKGLGNRMDVAEGLTPPEPRPEIPVNPQIERLKATWGDQVSEDQWDAIHEKAVKRNEPYSPLSIDGEHKGFYPNFDATPTGVIGDPKKFSNPKNIFKYAEPLNYIDTKYGATKQLIEKHAEQGLPVKITTASDLIAHDDYLNALPKNAEVNIVLPHPTIDVGDFSQKMAAIQKAGTQTMPSNQRLLLAYDKLRQMGVNVKVYVPDPQAKTIKELDPFTIKKLMTEENAFWSPKETPTEE